jgi:hypothetical protein
MGRVISRLVSFGYLLLAAAPGPATAQNAADICRDVLVTAAHNINERLDQSNIAINAKASLCSSSSRGSGSGTGLGVGYGGASLNFNNQQMNQAKANSCNNEQQSLDQNNLDIVLQNFVNNEAVHAWQDCMNKQGQGLRSLLERKGDNVIIKLWWVDRVGISSVSVTNDAQISGVSGPCAQSPWPKKGTEIKSFPLTYMCTQAGKQEVAFAVQTDRDSTTFFVPAYAPPATAPARSDRDLCFDGNSGACTREAAAHKQTCGNGPNSLNCQREAQCLDDMAIALDNNNQAAFQSMRSSQCRFPGGGRF